MNKSLNRYRNLHFWVQRNLGNPQNCSNCKLKDLKGHEIHWANKSGEYKKDLSDWIRLCAWCHSYFDRIGNLPTWD